MTPDDDDALARLAALHRAAGARDELAGVLVRRLRLAKGAEAARVRVDLSDLLAPTDPARAARLALDALEHEPLCAGALRALTTAPRASQLTPDQRAALLGRLAVRAGAPPAEAAGVHAARARLLAEAGDAAGALAAAREAARLGEEPDDLVDLHARLLETGGDRAEAARVLLDRARRAEARSDPQAAEWLADAGLRALAAGVAGGEEALRAALALHPERDTARAALEAIVRLARERGDAPGEREALVPLVPLLRTGARPAALLRLSSLALAANDPALARASAEEARVLAPRELAAVEACRAAALAGGDLGGVADLLGAAAALDPAGAGPRLLDRARILVTLGRAEEADDAYRAALRALAPDRALADEHARFRREVLPARSSSEPIEAFARRCGDAREAAAALRAAAALAFGANDLATALRCARGAYARTEADPAFVGPLLARVLYLMGGGAEALALHRRLLEAGSAELAQDDAVSLRRQLADLAEAAGDRELALRAVDELLRLRPQELEAALLRFELDPDRVRAARALGDAADACRSQRGRALALARAAEGALSDAADRDLSEELFRRAGRDAATAPALGLIVARRRAAAIRAAEGASSPAYLAALHDASAAAQAAGDRGAAIDHLLEAIQRERERGLFADAARDLLQVDALAAAAGDFAESAGRLRVAGTLLREAGDLAGASEALSRAYAANPDSEETARRLEDVLRARGAAGSAELVALLSDRAARARRAGERADALVRLAAAHAEAGDRDREEAALRAALVAAPGFAPAEDRLLALYRDLRRTGERARLLLERSARLPDGPARTELRREAARTLAGSPAEEDRELAAETWRAVAASHPDDLEAARAAAGLLLGLGRREQAAPLLAALVDANPEDQAAAGELAAAFAGRPLELAELSLARAARCEGEHRAARLGEAASAFFTWGDEDRAQEALRDAFAAWPGHDAGFAEALRAASGDVDQVDAILRARADAVPAEAATCHGARADALREAGRAEDAIAVYETLLAIAPADATTLGALAACVAESRGDAAAAGLDRELLARADAAPGNVPPAIEAQARYRVGLALAFAGKPAEAVRHLERAVSLAPHDGQAGLGWDALAQGHAVRGDGASALAAARARVERARALGLEEEHRAARQAEAELADRLGLPSALGPADVELGPDAGAGATPVFHVGPGAPEVEAFQADATDGPAALEPSAEVEDRSVLEWARGTRAEEDATAPEPGAAVEEAPSSHDPSAGHDAPATSEDDAAVRAAAWIASADALARSGGDPNDVRASLEMACEADPDSPEPWRARAAIEAAIGEPLAAARSQLSASIRSEGDVAAEAALEAARLFEEVGQHAEAARAYRVAFNSKPDVVPAAVLDAAEALAAGDADTATCHLSAVDPAELPGSLRSGHVRKLSAALAAAGRLEAARLALVDALAADPLDGPTRAALDALDARADDWRAAAAALGADAAQALDGADGAALYLRAARILHERIGDAAGAIAAVRASLARARSSDLPEAEATAAEGAALLRELGAHAFALEPAAPLDLPAQPETTVHLGLADEGAHEAEREEEPFAFGDGDTDGDPPVEPSARDAEQLARAGRDRMACGEWQAAFDQLALAHAAEPSDLTLARDLSRVAEKLKLFDEYVHFGEVCADAISAYDSLAAAARYRHFAEVLRDKVGAPDRAAVMLEKALALVPEDAEVRRELAGAWAELPGASSRALEGWLDLARRDPADGEALAAAAALCTQLAATSGEELAFRLAERGRLAASLAAFAAPSSHPAPSPAALAAQLSPQLRARVAVEGAAGPLAQLLRLLAPWLESLFPADLSRHGALPEHRLERGQAPAIAAALDGAARALGSRPFAAFLVERPGFDVTVENTRPPSLVLGAGVAGIEDAGLPFLAARTLHLVDHGWALVGKFAPRDLAILLELACRFAGGAPPSMGLPADRAGAFLAVLESQVPPEARAAARELGEAAAQELAAADPRVLGPALRRTANRVGLVYAGDPGAAIRALALLDRRLDAAGGDPVRALALPDLRDLALFALSEPFLELRAAALG